MLTSLRFKNWRSLKDVEINDLTPITVFVGANSSGKTNIFDGLKFIRSGLEKGFKETAFILGGSHNIHNNSVGLSYPTEVGFDSLGVHDSGPFSYKVSLKFSAGMSLPVTFPTAFETIDVEDSDTSEHWTNAKILSRRWQILDEDFLPPVSAPLTDQFDLYLIDPKARNVAIMLDFMRSTYPETFSKLTEHAGWLLDHIETLNTKTVEGKKQFSIVEKLLPNSEAATVSGGTLRTLAMLTAMYVLDASSPELPGLVAIEEPDTAIHPLLLDSLVELFRAYVDVDENGDYQGDGTNRRQIFLTTHNPRLLDYFKPKEVRLVERDEEGFTLVKPVPVEMAKIWLDEYGLGTAWVTRSLGGVPD